MLRGPVLVTVPPDGRIRRWLLRAAQELARL